MSEEDSLQEIYRLRDLMQSTRFSLVKAQRKYLKSKGWRVEGGFGGDNECEIEYDGKNYLMYGIDRAMDFQDRIIEGNPPF